MNDLVRFACERACEKYGSKDTFNGACFGCAFKELAGLSESLDGKWVRAILCGRSDIEILNGGCYYKIVKQ